MTEAAEQLRKIKRFDQLVAYLRDVLEWPMEDYPFEDLTFDWDAEELGIDLKTAAKIQEIKQLRPLASGQEWGIFFVKFEPKQLPVVALRRLLNKLVIKKRASAQSSDMASCACTTCCSYRSTVKATNGKSPLPTLRQEAAARSQH